MNQVKAETEVEVEKETVAEEETILVASARKRTK